MPQFLPQILIVLQFFVKNSEFCIGGSKCQSSMCYSWVFFKSCLENTVINIEIGHLKHGLGKTIGGRVFSVAVKSEKRKTSATNFFEFFNFLEHFYNLENLNFGGIF